MDIAMVRDAAMAAAEQKNDANSAEALKAAQDAVRAFVVLEGYGIFGTSPAGQSTDAVFAEATGVIDELIADINQAITVHLQNLHASLDAMVKNQEVSQVDYAKLTQDNRDRVDTLGDTGIKPTDESYVPPAAPARAPASGPATTTDPATAPGGDPDSTGLPS